MSETSITCPCCGHEITRVDAPNSDRAIEYYYRSKAAGGKRITLASVAEKFGYSAMYLSNVKQRYDHAGKWGAKHKVKP